jgi:hypothetical protein|tara:strand:- start:35 stop:445 length:411 start_codon:yes stop_codon:yes gene_type:complete
MAYNRKKINPLDLQPRKAVGVSLPFSGKAVFNSTFQTKEAIKANLINYFLTGVGERYLNPSFGTLLRDVMFENINEETINRAKRIVRQGLSEFFPRVIATDLQVSGEPNTNTIRLFLKYAIRDSNIEDEVLINFEQ